MRYRENRSGGGWSGLLGRYHFYRLGVFRGEKFATHDSSNVGRDNKRNERCWDSLHPGPPYRSGGPLNLWRLLDHGLTPQALNVVVHNGNYQYVYDGSWICGLTPTLATSKPTACLVVSTTADSDDGEIDDFGKVTANDGTDAWHKLKPGQPGADLAVFLAEATDTTRMLRTTAKGFLDIWRNLRSRSGRKLAKTVAQQHLNNSFGWLPFVSDVCKLYNTHIDADRRLNQIRRDNGQWIQRVGTVGQVNESEIVQYSATESCSVPSSNFFPINMLSYPKGQCSITRTIAQDTWFSARFRYWIPNIDSPLWGPNAYRKLMGLSITPEVLWELTPFSWLIDYFTNIGKIISSQTGDSLVNNLAAKYAYVMRHTRIDANVQCTINFLNSPISGSWNYELERKTRRSANPFGFDLTDADLSARQIGILAALGIDRAIK